MEDHIHQKIFAGGPVWIGWLFYRGVTRVRASSMLIPVQGLLHPHDDQRVPVRSLFAALACLFSSFGSVLSHGAVPDAFTHHIIRALTDGVCVRRVHFASHSGSCSRTK